MASDTEPMVVGSTYRLTLSADLDGEEWDLTGGTVTLALRDPDGGVVEYEATISGNEAYYDTAAADEEEETPADIDQAGDWSRSWKVEKSGIVQECPPISFIVVESP